MVYTLAVIMHMHLRILDLSASYYDSMSCADSALDDFEILSISFVSLV